MSAATSIASVAEFREYMSDVSQDNDPQGVARDSIIQKMLDRATSIIQGQLGFSFDGYSSSTQTVSHFGGDTLVMPPYQSGSITAIQAPGAFSIPNTWWFTLPDGSLHFNTGYGSAFGPGFGSSNLLRRSYYFGWPPGRYLITANFGYGAWPDSLKEVCLELAINIWRGKDRGMWTDVISDGSSSVKFTGGLTNQQRMIIDAIKVLDRQVVV